MAAGNGRASCHPSRRLLRKLLGMRSEIASQPLSVVARMEPTALADARPVGAIRESCMAPDFVIGSRIRAIRWLHPGYRLCAKRAALTLRAQPRCEIGGGAVAVGLAGTAQRQRIAEMDAVRDLEFFKA